MAATGMSGPLRHHYGTPRDHVLGLTMVSGDGKVLRWGGRVVKNVAGFDLTRLTIGSWGCLGVITSVSARLFPIPGADRTLIFRAADPRALSESARAMALSPLPLDAVELVDPLPTPALGEGEGERANPTAALVIRLLGSPAQVAAMADRVIQELSGDLGHPEAIEGEVSAGFHSDLGKREAEGDLVARLSLLPSELGTLLSEAKRLRALATGSEGGEASADISASEQGGAAMTTDARFNLSAHVGAGVLRVSVSGLPQGAGDPGPWISTLRGIRDRLEESGGSLILCRAPDPVLADVGVWGSATGEEKLMAGLKAQFDPHQILAPGRLGL
jgi:glycolate oxidase FAD binding subunit